MPHATVVGGLEETYERTSSTKAMRTLRGTFRGMRRAALKMRDSWTVAFSEWMSDCSTYPDSRAYVVLEQGWPFTLMSPVICPAAHED